jgi:RNA polymerase sigma-70 factor (ECF subfamily)
MQPEQANNTAFPGSPAFTTTLWTAVRLAGRGEGTSAAEALEKLCRIYWYPLYAYARRSGKGPEEARDLTQGFFARILANGFFRLADETKGKFRSYLLKSFQRFIGEEWDRSRAAKRGGGAEPISLDARDAETRYGLEPADELDPARIFERRWAVSLIEQTLERLEAEFKAAGKASQFAEMKPFLVGGSEEAASSSLAARLGVQRGAARQALKRFRDRYRALFREQVAQTVNGEQELEDELQHILRVLSA